MTNYIMHDLKTEKLEEWLKAHSIICQLPTADFSYSPRRGNLLSFLGKRGTNGGISSIVGVFV